MKYISSRIAFYSLVYVLIIFLIFFAQFKKGASYRYNNAHLQVSCRIFTNEKKQREVLLPLNITSNGLLISITAEEPIKFKMQDGNIRNTEILSYVEKENEFLLLLNDGVSLSFARNDKFLPSRQLTCESLYITCNFSKRVQEVYLPYKLTQRARIKRQGNAILVQYKGRSFAFSKEQTGLLGREESSPFIAFSKKSPSIYYQEQVQEEGDDIRNMLHSTFASGELYQKNLSHFRELAQPFFEKCIKEKRHNEDIVASLFSEYIRNSSYQNALSLYPSSILSKDKRSLKTALFYGNLIENYEKSKKQQDRLLDFISSLSTGKLKDKSSSIFAHPSWKKQNLFNFLLNRGRRDLIEFLFEECEEAIANEGTLSLYELANILQFCKEYKASALFEKNTEYLQKKCESSIYSHIFAIDDKLYVSKEKDKIDTFSTFYLAVVLIRYAELGSNEELKKIGYLLFNSLYAFTDNPSSFPSVFRIKADGKKKGLMATDAKIIPPEALYEIFFLHSSLFTHEVRLNSKNDPLLRGSSIFATTIAHDVKMRKTNGSLFLEFYFQKDSMHYAVVEGIESFVNVRIYEKLGYKTDTRFEKYDVAGYVYDKEKKRLYLKVDNRSEKEVIELIY